MRRGDVLIWGLAEIIKIDNEVGLIIVGYLVLLRHNALKQLAHADVQPLTEKRDECVVVKS